MFWCFMIIFGTHQWAIFNHMPMWKFCLSLPLILFLCWIYLNVYEIYIHKITLTFTLFLLLPPFKGNTATQQTSLPGKCGQLGLSQIGSKTGSVGSDLQFLGTANQDKGIYKYIRFWHWLTYYFVWSLWKLVTI